VILHSYGKGQNSTFYKIKTSEEIKIKFCRSDYVPEICPKPNLLTIGSLGRLEEYVKLNEVSGLHFSPTNLEVRPSDACHASTKIHAKWLK